MASLTLPNGQPILGFLEFSAEATRPRVFIKTPGQAAIDVTQDLSDFPDGNPLSFNDPLGQAARMVSSASEDVGAEAIIGWRNRLLGKHDGNGRFIVGGSGLCAFLEAAPDWILAHLLDGACNGLPHRLSEITPDGFVILVHGVSQRMLAYLTPDGQCRIVSVRFPMDIWAREVRSDLTTIFQQLFVPLRAFPECTVETNLDYGKLIAAGPDRAAMRLEQYIWSVLAPALEDPIANPSLLSPPIIPPLASCNEGETALRAEEERRIECKGGSPEAMRQILRAAVELVAGARRARGMEAPVGCVFITGYDASPYQLAFNGSGALAMRLIAAEIERRMQPRAKLLSHGEGNRMSQIVWRGACMVLQSGAAETYTAHDLIEAGAFLESWLIGEAGLDLDAAREILAGLADPTPL